MNLEKLRNFFTKEKKQILTILVVITLAAVVLTANAFLKGGLLKGGLSLNGGGTTNTPQPPAPIIINILPTMTCQYSAGAKPSITWDWNIPDSATTVSGNYFQPSYFTFKDTPNGSSTVNGSTNSSVKIESGSLTTRYYAAGTTQVQGSVDVYGCMIFEQNPGGGLTCQTFTNVVTKTCTAPVVAQSTVTTLALGPIADDGIFPGTPVQIIATVSSTGGAQNEFPTGNVTFKEGDIVLGSAAIAANTNKATLQTSFQSTGAHFITASYPGNAKYKASVSSSPLQVFVMPKTQVNPPAAQKTSTSVTFTSSAPNGAVQGSQINFEAILYGQQTIPTGKVVITDGVGGPVLFSKNLVEADNSTVSFSIASLIPGSHDIRLTYAGDTTNLATEKSLTQIVTAQNNLKLSCSASPANPKTGDTVSWSANISGVADSSQITYEWSGDFEKTGNFNASGKMSGTAQYNTAGTKSAQITVYNEPSPPTVKTCSVNVVDASPIEQKPPAKTQTPDILSCQNYGSKTLALSAHEQVYSSCSLSQNANITAYVLKDSYKSGTEIKVEDIVRTIIDPPQSYKPQSFSIGWTGNDDYDSPVDVGKYKIVVGAQFSENTIPDYSVLNIEVIQDPIVVSKTQTTTDTNKPAVVTAPPVKTKINDLFNPNIVPLTNNLHEAAKEASKCSGVFYPTDIATHWSREYVRYIIDHCILQGFSDGTFRPDMVLTRAQAVKIVLSAAGFKPETNCPNSSCGTGFKDLQPWEGPWIRAGQKLGLINGKGHTMFYPEAPMKREQYTVFSEQAMKVKPYQGCYTTNCGAGAPDNIFNDIVHAAAGAYLRTLTDLKIISGIGPNEFGVNQPLTRGEAAKIIAKIMALREKSNQATIKAK